MARPLRLELAGALYHVTSRGDGREDIYRSDEDRLAWQEVLAAVCRRFNWVCHAYCQMTNHYHVVVETPEANLSEGMRQLNGVYTQRFNRSHGRVGHVFQGRFKAILVDKDSYLLELARYVVLNPLRAKMVRRLEQWPWSSYLATCGQADRPDWLQVDFVLSQFSAQRARAIAKYVTFVHEGTKLPSIWSQLQGQVYLGTEAFIKKMQALVDKKPTLTEIPRAQRRALTRELSEYAKAYPRNTAIALAYLSGHHTMAAIANHFGVHYTTVSRLVTNYETEQVGKIR
ncbi:MAG: transposase [Burkholderiales bacterium]|jgi:REP element-mobilizing transposase RayT|nr:transposase [Burkholderiales bacterium]